MISSLNCIGCQACSDVCPVKAINFRYDAWGEGKASVDKDKCIGCGLCEKICPNINIKLNESQEFVYALVSKNNHEKGSSGGFFYELAMNFIEKGGIVFGAAFNDDLKLVHKKATTITELELLCKSKYLHSDMKDIYKELGHLLKDGYKVLFVGTPCQVSAVKNIYLSKYRDQLLLVDFLCHGTGTQMIFDLCIKKEELKRKGKIEKFYFRSKSRKAEHSFLFKLRRNGKTSNISGYYFEFPYYFSFLRYDIFNMACYSCAYSKTVRVGDITIGDFWGIQNYNSFLNDKDGVSMVSVNNSKGREHFLEIEDYLDVYKYPIGYATKKNQSFSMSEKLPKRRLYLNEVLINKGEDALYAELCCKNIYRNILSERCPEFVKMVYRRIRRAI